YAAQYSLSSEAIPPGRLGLGSAMINSGMAVGTSLGMLVAAGLAETWQASWRAPFWVMALPTAIVGLLIAWLIPDRGPIPAPQRSGGPSGMQAWLKNPLLVRLS